jgi:hypothetical protein
VPDLRLSGLDEQSGNLIAILGQQRVDIRWGTGIPLVLCNGIGVSLEVLDPFVAQLDPHATVMSCTSGHDAPKWGDRAC